ncbi:MAG: hypothetical protein ACJ77E_07625 [Gaiellaceae bacterium]
MRNAKATAAAAVVLAAILPAATQAQPSTTKPGVIYVLKVPVDDKGIHIPKDQFTRKGVTRYPRGALIRYEFTNKGTKPYAVHVWGADTVVMKARGGKAAMLINWQYRGEYHYWRISKGKRLTPVGTVVIF